jgi:23S rRNA pseudouridine1911/1915/1917 synthase
MRVIPSMNERIVEVEYLENDQERIDIFLAQKFSDLSRSRIQALIKAGSVLVDGFSISKPGTLLGGGEKIVLHIPPPTSMALEPEAVLLDILFENNDLVIINKDAGMVVHPSPGHDHGTLVHAILAHVPDLAGIGGVERPGIVHRLDKDTSGIIVIAKNDRSYHWLQDQFRMRQVVKTYLALVDGHPPTPTGRIDAPIGRSSSHRKMMAIVPQGKGREAVSDYKTIDSFNEFALLEVHPLTGRTHQIRVHLAFIGCPVAGDKVYGKKKCPLPLERQFLHAFRLAITLPGEGANRIFEAPLPKPLLDVLLMLRNNQR